MNSCYATAAAIASPICCVLAPHFRFGLLRLQPGFLNFGALAKRHREDGTGLRNLLAVEGERHGCGNHHIRAGAGYCFVHGFVQGHEIS